LFSFLEEQQGKPFSNRRIIDVCKINRIGLYALTKDESLAIGTKSDTIHLFQSNYARLTENCIQAVVWVPVCSLLLHSCKIAANLKLS